LLELLAQTIVPSIIFVLGTGSCCVAQAGSWTHDLPTSASPVLGL
jgi:hypothetical protein